MLAASNQIEGSLVMLPSASVKSDEPIMLDGMTVQDLERQIGLPVRAVNFAAFAHMFD